MNKPSAHLVQNEPSPLSPSIVMVEQYRVCRESVLITSLIQAYNRGDLTEKHAFLAVAELAAVRNLLDDLRSS